jgi:hypothetical protein
MFIALADGYNGLLQHGEYKYDILVITTLSVWGGLLSLGSGYFRMQSGPFGDSTAVLCAAGRVFREATSAGELVCSNPVRSMLIFFLLRIKSEQ